LRLLVQGIGEPVVADEPGQHDLLLAGLAGDRAAGGVVLARLGAGIAVRVVAELAQFPCAEDLADAGLDPSVFLGIPVPTLYRWRRYRCGPPGHRIGRHLRYLPDEVIAWLREQS
jgi:hypothetical protein